MLRPLICCFFFLLPLHFALSAAAPHPGAALYEKYCQECHGKQGEGVAGKYDDPFEGDRPLPSLIRKIEKTMPEGNEHLCVGEEAKQVAAYIHEAFYSPAAQAKRQRPEKDLSRLTVQQHRSSVMDLLGRFHKGPGFDRPINATFGIKGNYSGFEIPPPEEKKPEVKLPEEIRLEELKAAKAAEDQIAAARVALQKAREKQARERREEEERKRKERKTSKLERLDERISFHFGADSPDPKSMIPEEFRNRWDGGVIAPETGVYEFIVRSENGFRLWVNNDRTALIDGWVSSGPEVREEKKTIFLIGGRAYRLILEHFKFKEASASIELLWKPPHGTREVIPAHALRQDRPPPLMIVSTPFPADDRSIGYERGISVSKDWDQAVTDTAIATAEYVEANLDRLAGTKAGAPDRAEKLKAFARDFMETGFRRPLTEEEAPLYLEPHFQTAKSPEQAVKRVVLFTLKSPRFLYPGLQMQDKPDDFDIAARLALALWDSLPDQALTQAAKEGRLRTREQVQAQAQRMLPDPRTQTKLDGFFHHWLELDHAANTSKDPQAFPGFDEALLADLRASLFRFVHQVVWSPSSDYRELLQADYLLLNERLAKFYGQKINGSDFQRVVFDPKQRAGVITHPYLLAAMAYNKQTSPIHRGVFLSRNIVGLPLKAPPMAVSFDESHFDPSLTMREKITQLTRNQSCMSCHETINALGFSLENFDAVGRWRTQDNNKPVDPVTELVTEQGQNIRLNGPRDIANHTVSTPSGSRAFIRHLFHHTIKQPLPAYSPNLLNQLQESFASSHYHIQKLLIEIALIAALDDVES